jgi:phospholipase/carboxylesterase
VLSTCAIGQVGASDGTARDKHRQRQVDDHGRILIKRRQPVEDGPRGLHPLGLESGRDGLLYVPDGYRPDTPAPLVLMLHGSGGDAKNGIDPFLGFADDYGCILLAPASRDPTTWDLVLDGFGPDVTFIARALAQTFSRYAIDPARVAIEGFSDGASYALSMGATNGDLFTHLIAFSPGLFMPEEQHGWPIVYVAHGTADTILPIDQCSRKIVPKMRNTGYDVRYHEFDGPHTVLPEIAHEALDWFLPKGK